MPYVFFPENMSQEYAENGFASGLLMEVSEESLYALKEHMVAIKKYVSKLSASSVDVPSCIDATPRLQMGVLQGKAVTISSFSPSDTTCVANGTDDGEPGTYYLDTYPQNCRGIEDGCADQEYDLAEPPNETVLTKDGFEAVFRWDDNDICVVARSYDTMIKVCEQVLEEMETQSPSM